MWIWAAGYKAGGRLRALARPGRLGLLYSYSPPPDTHFPASSGPRSAPAQPPRRAPPHGGRPGGGARSPAPPRLSAAAAAAAAASQSSPPPACQPAGPTGRRRCLRSRLRCPLCASSLAAQRKHGGGQGVSRPAPSLRPQVKARWPPPFARKACAPGGAWAARGPPPGEKEAPGPAGPLPPPLGPYCPSVYPEGQPVRVRALSPYSAVLKPRGVLHPRMVRRGSVSGPRPSLVGAPWGSARGNSRTRGL